MSSLGRCGHCGETSLGGPCPRCNNNSSSSFNQFNQMSFSNSSNIHNHCNNNSSSSDFNQFVQAPSHFSSSSTYNRSTHPAAHIPHPGSNNSSNSSHPPFSYISNLSGIHNVEKPNVSDFVLSFQPQNLVHRWIIKFGVEGKCEFELDREICKIIGINENDSYNSVVEKLKSEAHRHVNWEDTAERTHYEICQRKIYGSDIESLEMIGEICAYIAMKKRYGDAIMLSGLDDKPQGIDQVWFLQNESTCHYYIVEAKGAKGKLSHTLCYQHKLYGADGLLLMDGARQLEKNWVFGLINMLARDRYIKFLKILIRKYKFNEASSGKITPYIPLLQELSADLYWEFIPEIEVHWIRILNKLFNREKYIYENQAEHKKEIEKIIDPMKKKNAQDKKLFTEDKDEMNPDEINEFYDAIYMSLEEKFNYLDENFGNINQCEVWGVLITNGTISGPNKY